MIVKNRSVQLDAKRNFGIRIGKLLFIVAWLSNEEHI